MDPIHAGSPWRGLLKGRPGPLVNLRSLGWGDRIIVHSGGEQYVYEVRSVGRVVPGDKTIFRHEKLPWITLVTCQGYNANNNTFLYRTVVRAVLISVSDEGTSP